MIHPTTRDQVAVLLAAMEVLPDGFLLVDREQRIVGCNRVLEGLFGYARGELVGRPLGCLLPERIRARHATRVEQFDGAGGGRAMDERPILTGITRRGERLPLTIGISSVGEGRERLYVAVVRDARALDRTFEGIRLQAETDPLTGLANRRHLMSRLSREAPAADGPLALLFLDLDGFKPVNDRHGHEVGDEVLRIVARRLRRSVRDADTCARLGGDEFAVLLRGAGEPGTLERIALELHASVSAPVRPRGQALRISVGASIGGAIAPAGGTPPSALLDRADAAMYRAKRDGAAYCLDGSPPAGIRDRLQGPRDASIDTLRQQEP